MHVDYMTSDMEIIVVIFLIKDDEKEVEARHDRRGYITIVA